MMIMPVWYFVLGVVVILIPMVFGFYMLHKRQSEMLQVGQEQSQQLNSISDQTTLIPNIDRQFMTPQYLAQYIITLENHNKNVLRLGDIVFVTVNKKMLEFHTIDRVFKMDGKLNKLTPDSNPILPFPLFVRIHKSYIINVLQVEKYFANKVAMKDENSTLITISPSHKNQLYTAFERSKNNR